MKGLRFVDMSKKPFSDIFEDKTKYGTKIKTDEYHASGAHIIVDQGQPRVAGYSDLEEGLFVDVPVIIFGDHTRAVKYIDEPFFLGADGVKVLKGKLPNANHKYLYYALRNARIPNTGYNRHFKWLKELYLEYPEQSIQDDIVRILDKTERIIELRQTELQLLDELIKARFIEIFGEQFSGTKIKVGDIANVYIGLTYKPENVTEDGTIVLRSGNIQNQSLQTETDIVRVSGITIADNKYIRDKDILMCARNGSARLVGKSCLIRKPKEDMAFGAFMSVIRTEYPYFLQGFFSSEYFKKQLTNVGTTSVNQITSKMLNNYSVIMPTKKQEKEFGIFCDQVEKSKAAVKTSINETQLLFNSLMQEYFG